MLTVKTICSPFDTDDLPEYYMKWDGSETMIKQEKTKVIVQHKTPDIPLSLLERLLFPYNYN